MLVKIIQQNGSFKLTEWSHSDKIVLEKNEYYWDADTVKLKYNHYALW